jgi:CO/xanthine dehydrogenase Mo-binding subunit
MARRELKYVGRSVPRVDGIEKVTGTAKFVGDIVVPGMLYGRILRSTYPHARIRSIDTSQAEALPGVIAVLTSADITDLNPIYNGRDRHEKGSLHRRTRGSGGGGRFGDC